MCDEAPSYGEGIINMMPVVKEQPIIKFGNEVVVKTRDSIMAESNKKASVGPFISPFKKTRRKRYSIG